MSHTEGLRPEVLRELEQIFGPERLLASPEDLLLYSYDGTWVESRPGAVVFPLSAEEVSQVLILANRERIPVTPRGAATRLSGGAVPVSGGIVLNMTRMERSLGGAGFVGMVGKPLHAGENVGMIPDGRECTN